MELYARSTLKCSVHTLIRFNLVQGLQVFDSGGFIWVVKNQYNENLNVSKTWSEYNAYKTV
jgi:hypothetical protein